MREREKEFWFIPFQAGCEPTGALTFLQHRCGKLPCRNYRTKRMIFSKARAISRGSPLLQSFTIISINPIESLKKQKYYYSSLTSFSETFSHFLKFHSVVSQKNQHVFFLVINFNDSHWWSTRFLLLPYEPWSILTIWLMVIPSIIRILIMVIINPYEPLDD